MKTNSLLLALFCCLLATACDEIKHVDATTVLVSVHSDLGAEIASVEAALFDDTETQAGQKSTIPARQFPFSFIIVPARPEMTTRPFLLVLTARDAGGNVLAQAKALAAFSREKSLLIQMRLGRECRGKVCSAGQACTAVNAGFAECAAVQLAATRETDRTPGSELVEVMTSGAITGEGGVQVEPGSDAGAQGLPPVVTSPGAVDAPGPGAMPGPGATVDGGQVMTAPDAAGPMPMGECDATRSCSPGYACTSGRCVSMCMQTVCPADATCSLVGGMPVCACGPGFIQRSQPNNTITCLRDVQCTELRCDVNATCDVGTDQIRKCNCKSGYTGPGTSCTPVSCGALTVQNGTVQTNGGTFGQTATYTCDTGYTRVGGTTRRCEATGSWSGTAATCEPHDCGTPSSPANGRATVSNGTRYPNGTVRYTCNTNFSLSTTTDTRTCTPTGWSGTAPSCLGCGDGIVTSPRETCDTGSLFADPWTCDPATCRTRRMYTACSSDAGCDAGQMCFFGRCTHNCTSVGQCESTAAGSPTCDGGSLGGFCFVRCTSSLQCPSGLTCTGNGPAGSGYLVCEGPVSSG